MGKLVITFIFLSMLISCSFNGTEAEIPLEGETSTLVPKDLVELEEDDAIVVNLAEVYSDSSFHQTYEIVKVQSDNAQAYFTGEDIHYIPFKNYFGVDYLKAFVRSRTSENVLLLKIQMKINGVNDKPVAFDDTAKLIDGDMAIDVLANDIDVDGEELSLYSVNSIDDASVTIVDGKVLFSPEVSFNLPAGESVKINYKVSDTSGNISDGSINLFNSDVVPLNEDQLVPLKILFIKSSAADLSTTPEVDAQYALSLMNEKLQKEDQQFAGFKLDSVSQIEDDELFNMCNPTEINCVDYDKLVNRYNQKGVVTLAFVNNISGSVAGIARVDKLPQSSEATVVAEYTGLKKNTVFLEKGTIYTHELGHLLGLEHTQQIGSEEDVWELYAACGHFFSYYQRAGKVVEEPYEDQSGNFWNDYNNTMKSIISNQASDHGFFTEGYDPVFSKIFTCYRARAI